MTLCSSTSRTAAERAWLTTKSATEAPLSSAARAITALSSGDMRATNRVLLAARRGDLGS